MAAVVERSAADYEHDVYAWALEQVRLLRAGTLSELDVEHLIEELEALAASSRRELKSRLKVLIQHLLKYKYQPQKRSISWRTTIRDQRYEITSLLDDNPSLRPRLADFIANAYSAARDNAADETGKPVATFPISCDWTVDFLLSNDLPGE